MGLMLMDQERMGPGAFGHTHARYGLFRLAPAYDLVLVVMTTDRRLGFEQYFYVVMETAIKGCLPDDRGPTTQPTSRPTMP
jgi:hypothetical protein